MIYWLLGIRGLTFWATVQCCRFAAAELTDGKPIAKTAAVSWHMLQYVADDISWWAHNNSVTTAMYRSSAAVDSCITNLPLFIGGMKCKPGAYVSLCKLGQTYFDSLQNVRHYCVQHFAVLVFDRLLKKHILSSYFDFTQSKCHRVCCIHVIAYSHCVVLLWDHDKFSFFPCCFCVGLRVYS